MQFEYAWAFSRGVVGSDEVSAALAVVVGRVVMLATVGDEVDPPEQAAAPAQMTTMAAGKSFEERSLRADSLEVMAQSRQPPRCQPVCGFRYAGDTFRLGPSRPCAC